jgi:copper chaperone CopZ
MYDIINSTVNLGHIPLTSLLPIVLAFLLFYWAMYQVRRDIKALTAQLKGLDTITTVDAKLVSALELIEDQRTLIKEQTKRMDDIERGIREVAVNTAADVALALEKALQKTRGRYRLVVHKPTLKLAEALKSVEVAAS